MFEGWDDADTSRNGAYIADPADISTLKRLTSPPRWRSRHPDGRVARRFAGTAHAPGAIDPTGGGSAETARLIVVGTDGTGLIDLMPEGFLIATDTQWGNTATWSPDGRQVAVVATSASGGTQGNLYIVDATGGVPKANDNQPHDIENASGRRMALGSPSMATRRTPTASSSSIPTAPAARRWSPPKQLMAHPSIPARRAARCGHQTARSFFQVTTDSSGGTDLYTINADGSNLVRLTNDPVVHLVQLGSVGRPLLIPGWGTAIWP